MSDTRGGQGGPGTDDVPVSRRGRRVRPGAVPDGHAGGHLAEHAGAQPAVAPEPVRYGRYDRDAVFDVDDADGPGSPVAGSPVAGSPVGDEPVAEEPVVDDPAAEEPVPEDVQVADLLEDRSHPEEHDAVVEDVDHEVYAEPLDHPEHADAYDDEYGDLHDDLHDDPEAAAAERRRRGRRRRRTAVALVISLALLGGAVYAGWSFLSPIIDGIGGGEQEVADFPGPGSGEVDVVVQPGDTGGAIGETLTAAGVVASRAAFVAEFTATPEAAALQPGTYRLRAEMSASDALALLLDPTSRQSLRVGVREGLWVAETLTAISEETGFTVDELTAALADPAVGLPPEAEGNAEGYLFPATYDFPPDVTPVQILTAMVARHTEAMDAVGVPAEQRREVLIRASIIQGEASREEDLARVSRVIQNRLDRGETLGMDSTVGYVVQKRALDLTVSDLETDSPYNTRINPGLPPGPINNPGEAAIAAALTPAEGDWLYFVTVDGDTGETVFTADYDEFLAAKQQFQEWLAANP